MVTIKKRAAQKFDFRVSVGKKPLFHFSKIAIMVTKKPCRTKIRF